MTSQQQEHEWRETVRKSVSPANKSLTDTELDFYIAQCNRLGFDPLLRHAQMIPRSGSVKFEISIDGYRTIADATGEYAGSGKPEYEGFFKLANGVVAAKVCRVPVSRMIRGILCEFIGEAHFDEFNTGRGKWLEMPKRMLAVRAEENGLKKGFPSKLSGVYTTSEMDDEDDRQQRDQVALQKPEESKGRLASQPSQEPHTQAIEAQGGEGWGSEALETPSTAVSDNLAGYRTFCRLTYQLGIVFAGTGGAAMQRYLRFLMGADIGYDPRHMTGEDWRGVSAPLQDYLQASEGAVEEHAAPYTSGVCRLLYPDGGNYTPQTINAVQWRNMAAHVRHAHAQR